MFGIRYILLFVAISLLLFAHDASAVVSVGPAPCAFRTIQSAINAILASERNGDFFDTAIVVVGDPFSEALVVDSNGINGGAELSISGGFDGSCSAATAGARTTVNPPPAINVLTIRGNSRVTLRQLTLTGAHTNLRGGGITFDGSGTLDIYDTEISGNNASYGGGIYANGQDNGIDLTIHAGTVVSGNHADHAGGGLRLQGNTRLTAEPGFRITGNDVNNNDADGTGGGIQVLGPARALMVDVSIDNNTARHGGGVYANSTSSTEGVVTISASSRSHASLILNNAALTGTGGGIQADAGGIVACADCVVSLNAAREGAAIYADTASDRYPGGEIRTLRSSISQNFGIAGGATVLIQTGARVVMDHATITFNSGAQVFRGFGTDDAFPHTFLNSLIANNSVSGDLFSVDEDGATTMRSVTVAGNTINGSAVFSLTGFFTLEDSLAWQPGVPSLTRNSLDERTVLNVFSNDPASLGGGPTVQGIDPKFVNPSQANYHLQPTSPAIDFAPAEPGTDLEGNLRSVDLPIVTHPGGVLDLGAYELQALPEAPLFCDGFDGVHCP